ncbi:hypothetical protein AVEN_88940-1 [Araneus ventricosus]|uniref:Uncharacterized protein n=1 Tax=Araneus ventricosus TaxID=182803 RepID=A0A4Y2DIL2_ARAVE|nr:hypothetical protein AVEN_88940-1 [Araneus ventricosus]
MKQIYFDIIKEIEEFEELFSLVAFIVVFKNYCITSFILMDIMNVSSWLSKLVLESSFYLAFVCGSTGVLSVYAANIPLEIQNINSLLLDKLSVQAREDGLSATEKQIYFLLKRKVCVLTFYKVFSFDRGFVLKGVATIIGQAVVFNQLGSSIVNSVQ